MELLRVLALGSVKEEGDEPAVRRTTKTQQRGINSGPELFSGRAGVHKNAGMWLKDT